MIDMQEAIEAQAAVVELDPLNEFWDSIPNPKTRANYTRQLKIFFDYSKLSGSPREQAAAFASHARKDNVWASSIILDFIRFEKLRVEQNQISASSLTNFTKPIRLFLEMNDLSGVVNWKKVMRRLPKGRSHSSDEAPQRSDILTLLRYPDRRIPVGVLIMASSGARLGVFDYLTWGDFEPIIQNGKLLAAWITIYKGEAEQYRSLVTPETYRAVEDCITFREKSGEKISKDSPVLRDLFIPDKGGRGLVSKPKPLKSSGLKILVQRALKATGIRKALPEGKKRYPFKTNHGFRKFHETTCIDCGMDIAIVKILRGDSLELESSYYRPSDQKKLGEYVKAIPALTFVEKPPVIVPAASSERVESLEKEVAYLRSEMGAISKNLRLYVQEMKSGSSKRKSRSRN